MTQTMYAHMNKWKKILVTDEDMMILCSWVLYIWLIIFPKNKKVHNECNVV
jgi:hypothetical protein